MFHKKYACVRVGRCHCSWFVFSDPLMQVQVVGNFGWCTCFIGFGAPSFVVDRCAPDAGEGGWSRLVHATVFPLCS